MSGEATIRSGGEDDAGAVARMLDAFNREFGEATPGSEALTVRLRELMRAGEIEVLLAGAGPDGVAVLRFRPSIWTRGLECHVAELYVAPDRRGRGLGRALMERALALARDRGADGVDLNTAEDDRAARALYESLGFRNREGRPDGPLMYFYEREL